MVAAVHFFATPEDEAALLDFLGEPTKVTLHPWPMSPLAPVTIDRRDLGSRPRVMVVSKTLGPPRLIQAGDPAFGGGSPSAVFNRMNWERLNPAPGEALVDSNASPVLLWQRGALDDGVLHQSEIGSQADAMADVSVDYERWVTSTLSWVRRRGARVWGLNKSDTRPGLDVTIDHVSSVYALPGALAAFEAGYRGRR